ncbi:MAG TPA: hypothetical protein VNO30_16570 [Kofleriaceae bacterium]|nr:hypothetical protein [Kofleriaceae bacterium]
MSGVDAATAETATAAASAATAETAATVFLLSPARCSGERAARLVRSKRSELGRRLRAGEASIGEIFAWLSALYFRGKLTYALRFGSSTGGAPGALVMAPGLGLRAPETRLSVPMFQAMGEVDVESDAFVRPLLGDARLLARLLDRAAGGTTGGAAGGTAGGAAGGAARVVLLGSIATGKYISTLLDVFGERLLFPATFVGRGDMSRGGLLLRAARSGEELAYRPVAGATLRGARPPKLPRIYP